MAFSPYLAESDIPGIITVIAAFLYGLYWFFRKMAESKERERQLDERKRTRERGPEEEEEDENYVADEQEVRRFLDTLGVEAEPRPEPPRRPQPTQPAMPPPAQPGRPPQRPLQPEPLLLESARPKPRPAPPQPEPRQRVQPEQPEEAYVFGAGPTEPAATKLPQATGRVVKRQVTKEKQEAARGAASPADRLAFPHLTPLQRAIILSDILGRRPGPHRHGRR